MNTYILALQFTNTKSIMGWDTVHKGKTNSQTKINIISIWQYLTHK